MSYLQDYLRYASANEAPEIFHVWAAYFCLSTASRRRVWMPFADTYMYPNLYVMFVGGAGNAKSEALGRAKRMLKELDVPISANIETPEGLWHFMSGNPEGKPPTPSPVMATQYGPAGIIQEVCPMAIIADEFVNFIAPNPEGWMSALNEIFGCNDYIYRTKNKGTSTLPNPYVTLLGALTTEVSATLHKQNIIGTGMGRRTLFQFGERDWGHPIAWPMITDDERAARARCIEHLRNVQRVSGQFTITPAAHDFYESWYHTNHKKVPTMTSNLKSWFGTKAARLHQLAMLTSLSEGFDLVIDVPHYEVPLAYLELLDSDLAKVFGGVGRNELAGVAQRIRDYVDALSLPETKASLKSKFFGECKPPMEFDECITYLNEAGHIWSTTIQVGSAIQDLIASPQVMAHHVVRIASSSPTAVAAPLLDRARQLLADRDAVLNGELQDPPGLRPTVDEVRYET